MQKKFTLYNLETHRSRDHGSAPVIAGAACDVITGTGMRRDHGNVSDWQILASDWEMYRVSQQNCRFFRPNFRLQSLGNPLSESLEIYCASRPDYGPLSIKISSDSDKRYPSYCRWKFEIISQWIVDKVKKNSRFFRSNFRLQSLGNPLSESLVICCSSCPHYGPLWIKISSDSDKRFPSDCS